LLTRLADNEATLQSVCNLLTEAVTANYRLTPAGEWLLDNLYLIRSRFDCQAPPAQGYGVSYAVGARLLCRPAACTTLPYRHFHGDGRVDAGLSRFVAAYQSGTLQLGGCGPFRSCCGWR
jgi:hypothetical protein